MNFPEFFLHLILVFDRPNLPMLMNLMIGPEISYIYVVYYVHLVPN